MAAPAVAVFGSSEPVAGEPPYEQARELGRLLAGAGHRVVTGGYGGVMEGASRGAAEAGGETLGVCCTIFDRRKPNPYLTRVVFTADLHERTQRLIEEAAAFVVLPGKSGTLAELCLVWALQRAGCLGARPVVLLGSPWKAFLAFLAAQDLIDAPQLESTRMAGSPRAVLEQVASWRAPGDGRP